MVNTGSTKPQKTALLLAQRIVRDIEQQGLGPGQKLPPERSMMHSYETGRGTLRESLRFLELQGVLTLKPGPGGGPVIQKPTAGNLATTLALVLQFDDARHRVITEARSALEPLMARLAARRATPTRLLELQQTLADMEEGLDDTPAYLDANRRFHQAIAWSSDNSLFGFLLGAIDLTDHTVSVEQPIRRRQSVLRAHHRIYEAIAQGRPEVASEEMTAHMDEDQAWAEKKHPEVREQHITWP
ncbi:FadR/GntR family transcriptional regulator [Kineosporia succinea]|uniref:DNA-binding FadR family transcriptional regulator n=1 Tax=Kineosporia succinea TaxID=84632 RepID=A0ABT9P7T9_9ACTN|nr:FadR/GntR family transcriptional regulator [Kineosporia succinea]MDP9828479.1 DNA-binding FadR family transcriptional regulator [Kineosporia succinea]